MDRKRLLILIIPLVLLVANGFAKSQISGSGSKIYDKKWLNANRWVIPIYNDGRFGIDIGTGTDVAGGYWPKPLKNFYIFGAGVWFGYISATGETCVTYGYNPNSGASEMVPVLKKDFTSGYEGNPDYKIYMFPDDWPPPKDKFTVLTESGDTVVFCPQETLSIQDAWSCFSDHDPKKHDPNDTRPIGVDISMTGYVWNLPTNRDIVFIRYDLRNVSGDTLKKCQIGIVLDADVGAYSDDMMGMVVNRRTTPAEPKRYVWNAARTDSLFVDNLAWIYDNDNRESPGSLWERGTPGAVAYDFLQTPYALDDSLDNDHDDLIDRQEVDSTYICTTYPPEDPHRDSDGDGIPAWRDFSEIEQLGMTACKFFPIENDPRNDPERYLAMAGYTHYLRPPVYDPYDDDDATAADKRFLQSSGPFTLLPESTVTLMLAVIGAKYGEEGQPANQRDTWDLAKASVEAQKVYDNNWLLPAAPLVPNFQVIPGDKKITVVWDNSKERVPDPYYRIASRTDPTYREYDFEGYKVYKSTDGINWSQIAICDAQNGIKWTDTTITLKVVEGETTKVESIYTWAMDNGLFYSYLDEDVVNGMEYHYAVTAFDYNFMRGERLVLEAGIQEKMTIPRKEAANFVFPTATIVQTRGDSINTKAKWKVSTPNPTEVEDAIYELQFISLFYDTLSNAPVFRLLVTKKGVEEPIMDTVRILYDSISLGKEGIYSIPYFAGLTPVLAFELDSALKPFDSVVVSRYPKDSITLMAPANRLLWLFRGSNYKLVWENKEGGGLTLKVYDIDNETLVAYQPLTALTGSLSGSKAKYGDGWSFQNRIGPSTTPSDTLRGNDAAIYLPGGIITFNKARPLTPELRSLIQPGDTWYIYSNKAYGCGLSHTKYELTTTKASFSPLRKEFKVKVVPNPYIVTNQWEKTTLSRKIAFTGLPGKCKIRIYNMAGDLVKIIEHQADGTQKNEFGGTATWNLLNTHDQKIASGVYIFYVESDIGESTGKFAVVY